MNFGPEHYVPVLKVKKGEKEALALVEPSLKQRITPLLEIVERKAEKKATVEGHLVTAFKGLASSLVGYARCFIDVRELASDGAAAAASVFDRADADGIVFTPVTGLSRTADAAAALRHRTHGIAIRLTRAELEAGGLAARIGPFIQTYGLSPGEVDLIVDLGELDELIVEGIVALTESFLGEVPDHGTWRTLTVSGSAFPISMGGVDRNSHDFAERAEWVAWRDNLYANRSAIVRLPTFSDCAIQHPKGVEGFDPRIMQSSASIRYTTADSWLLVKGEGTRKAVPSVQFPRLATTLVYGHLKSSFVSSAHCAGCSSIKAAADGAEGFGSAGTWRRLGTIHHLTSVVGDLRALPWP